MNPNFFGCPSECAYKPFSVERRRFCDDYDHKQIEDKFRENVEKFWKKNLGLKAKKFRFDEMLSVLYSVLAAEDLPPGERSAKTNKMLEVYLCEKARDEHIEWYNERKND